MSMERSALWVCDQCEVEVRTTPSEQPEGWLGIAFHVPPESSEPQGRRLHICKECAEGKGLEHAVVWLHRLVAS